MKRCVTIYSFEPVLWDCLRRGYSFEKLKNDLNAGLNVAVISLPLALTFSNACRVGPESGVYATIIGGLFASIFGGTRFLISGPTPVFLITCLSLVQQFGFEGLFLATFMAGIILIICGIFRVGSMIDFIPYSVMLGYVTGLSVIILTLQIKDCLGLAFSATGKNSANQIISHWFFYAESWRNIHWPTLLLSIGTIAPIMALKRFSKGFPMFVIVLLCATWVAYILNIDVTTVGKKYGHITSLTPHYDFPYCSLQKIVALIPSALTIAFLAGINGLLASEISKEITNQPTKPDIELIGQGVGNITSALFGGLPVAATLARSMTNIKSHARTPLAAIFSCVFIAITLNFGFMKTIIEYMPIPCLSAVLMTIAYDMMSFRKFFKHLTIPNGEQVILLSAFLLTIFVDISVAILAGTVLASLMFMRRMSAITDVRSDPVVCSEIPETIGIYHIDGPFFFGAASRLKGILDEQKPQERFVILDLEHMPMIDSSGTWVLMQFIKDCNKRNVQIILTNLTPHAKSFFDKIGIHKKKRFITTKNLDDAVKKACSLFQDTCPK